jgi:hypothetical protein
VKLDAEMEWKKFEQFLVGEEGISEVESDLYSQLYQEILQISIGTQLSPLLKTIREPVRIYLEGCFDLMHSGHFNAIRQVIHIPKLIYTFIFHLGQITWRYSCCGGYI